MKFEYMVSPGNNQDADVTLLHSDDEISILVKK